MLDFIIQRLIQAIFVVLVVAMISFSLFQFVGDPVNNMVGQDASLEQRPHNDVDLRYVRLVD